MIQTTLLGILVFLGAMTISYSGARCDQALLPPVRKLAAANWNLLAWIAAAVGFVVAVKVDMWMLVPEGVGVWCGMLVGAGKGPPRPMVGK